MGKSKGRRIGNPAARARATEEPIVTEARAILARLDRGGMSYELVYYALDPTELSVDLDVPLDGELHSHGSVLGKTLHLDESRRHATIERASRAFTGPFLAVPVMFEDVDRPLQHATIVLAADLQSETLMNSLRVVQIEHRIEALHFGAFVALSTEPPQWTPEDEIETNQLREDWQLRVEAEAVIAAGRIVARKVS